MWRRLAEDYEVAYISEPLMALASRETAPRLWGEAESLSQKQIEQMFREARIRHFYGRPTRLRLELARHRAFTARVRVYRVGSIAKSWLRRVGGKATGRVRSSS
jgi:hypothetical protein